MAKTKQQKPHRMATTKIDRQKHGQLISSTVNGDCFRASMSVLLSVPNGDHLPNGPDYFPEWYEFLAKIGLTIQQSNARGPIWKEHYWIASVPSKNYDCSHAIVMRCHQVAFDPSPKKRYRVGESLLGRDIVHAGTWLEVSDAMKLDHFVRWKKKINAKGKRNAS